MQDIRQGNCFEILKSIPDKSIDLIITDPPYEIVNTNGGGRTTLQKSITSALGELDDAEISNGYDIIGFCEECIRVMKSINIYIWCNKKQIPKYFDFFVEIHKCKFDVIIWNKTNAPPTYSNKYLTDCEYCLYFHGGKGKCFPQNYEDAKSVYIAPINHQDKKKYGHPTIKPLELIRKLVRNSSQIGDTILDPFAGSGTTNVACELEHRNSIGIEINPEFVNIIKRRLSEVSAASVVNYSESKVNKRRLF